MKNNLKLMLLVSVAALVSCTQHNSPTGMHGDRGLTSGVDINRHTVKMVCGRAHGASYGFKLLGILPIKQASEAEAVDRMYENARQRGASPDGRARQFVNNSVERSANYFILGSMPVVYAAGDLVEIQDVGAGGATNNGTAPKGPGIGDVITAPLNIYAGAVNKVLGN
ncbi:MAG: hypothetical protein IJB33_05960 [Akkermansia sp.]|nr:hypothetical protein [Akkermansia sp.]MBQ7024674.1 hypothetical protein [Akkermansia sp.]